ncbi:hypothetical protein GCM10009665_60400 [Kitasatospora nipponensis]|uniref:Putative amidase domain-containing protein n=1 Tax=Kitasatospora nipponensis TaxID=258049 RepID=A0ABP4HI94_9ACTN
MVTLGQLANADQGAMQRAAGGWMALSKEAWQAVNDIHDNGVDPLKSNWQDRVGQSAGQKLAEQARILEAGADVMRGVAMVLDGLAASTGYAQSTLNSALDLARGCNLVVDLAQGVVVPGPGQLSPDDREQISQVDRLLAEAQREATQADRQAAAELRKLGAATCLTDPDAALNQYQNEASRTELAMYQGDIPTGADPATVAAWWRALTPAQQQQLQLSEPVALAGLDGIPDSVKLDLRGGPDAKYDRVKLVQWTLDHWNDDSTNVFDDNCTNFASEALAAAGVQYKGDWTLDGDGWGKGGQSGWNWLDAHDHSHTASWAAAQNMHDFMVGNGGQEIPPDQVKPGDLVYYEEDSDQDGQDGKGVIHHTAIVTAVTPDGDIRYTQHSGDMQNGSIGGRMDAFQEGRGHQKLHFVRVQPNWY